MWNRKTFFGFSLQPINVSRPVPTIPMILRQCCSLCVQVRWHQREIIQVNLVWPRLCLIRLAAVKLLEWKAITLPWPFTPALPWIRCSAATVGLFAQIRPELPIWRENSWTGNPCGLQGSGSMKIPCRTVESRWLAREVLLLSQTSWAEGSTRGMGHQESHSDQSDWREGKVNGATVVAHRNL